jgi:hypothetical protein
MTLARHRHLSSLDDAQRQPGRAATVHQRGDLMPVDVCRNSSGQRRRYFQPRELCYAIEAAVMTS